MKNFLNIAAFLVLSGSVVIAQDINPDAETASGPGGEMRVLDKLTGALTDLALQVGETATVGRLRVTLNQCRYPAANPSGDAYAEIVVHYRDSAAPVFAGWMFASSPALSAMDHPRYDVWALRCMTSSADGTGPENDAGN